MSRRFLVQIEYDGTSYCGWQAQDIKKSKKPSIQQVVEGAIFKLFNTRVKVYSSGRTDSGVHSLAQYAHFDVDTHFSDFKILKAINSYLPEDVAIVQCRQVGRDFNSRFLPSIRTYTYTIVNRSVRPVIQRMYCCFIPYHLNVRRMQKEIKFIIGKHDFKCFQAKDKKERLSIRTITAASVRKKGDKIYIQISANGFLYNMVRNIVGTLIDIGRGKLPQGSMKKILDSKDRFFAGPTAPAKGLCLTSIDFCKVTEGIVSGK